MEVGRTFFASRCSRRVIDQTSAELSDVCSAELVVSRQICRNLYCQSRLVRDRNGGFGVLRKFALHIDRSDAVTYLQMKSELPHSQRDTT